jgi:hypothetical protein
VEGGEREIISIRKTDERTKKKLRDKERYDEVKKNKEKEINE